MKFQTDLTEFENAVKMKGMSHRPSRHLKFARRSFLFGAVASIAAAQNRVAARTDYIGRSGFPSMVRIQLDRLGDRLVKAGKERTVMQGTFVDAAGAQSPAQLVYQLPDRFRLQTTGALNKIVAFDGETAQSTGAQIDSAEEDLLESFVADSPEGFFDSLRSGAALRLLGRRFRPAPSIAPDYKGPLYDIYELAGVVRTRRDRRNRVKRFYFDSASALLLRVRYNDASRGTQVSVETRYSQWRDVAGNPLPGQVERLEKGKLVFAFRLASADLLPQGDEGIFRNP
jgi:hypothetical protein